MAKCYLSKTALCSSRLKISFCRDKHVLIPSKFCLKTCKVNIRTRNYLNAVSLGLLKSKSGFLTLGRFYCKVSKEMSSVIPSESSSFQQLLSFRRKQAECSVLLSLSHKEDIPFAFALCQDFGSISNVYSYKTESGNIILMLEFVDKKSVSSLLSSCQCRNILDAFPVYSRMIQFEKKYEREVPNVDVNILEDNPLLGSPKSKGSTVSELIEDIYSSEKISELNTRLRYFFCTIIKDSVSGLFPYCDVLPFGSSVNGLGRHGSDLDVMIRLYPTQANSAAEFFFLNKTCVGDLRSLQQKTIFALGDTLRTFLPGISSVHKILNARMPILKLKHKILKMDCDVSVNNMSAILMSEIIYFCGEVDPRVRPLIYSVKKWAKEAGITYEAPGSWITNFGLSLLVLFFLQTRPLPILPPLKEAIHILGEESSIDFRLEYLKPVSEWKEKASLNKEPLAFLLNDFLTFLGTFSFKDKQLSILSGSAREGKTLSPMWVQYPMEEDLNVTKNISEHEMWDMREKARTSAKYLNSNLNYKVTQSRDLAFVLGLHNLKKFDSHKSRKIDVAALVDDQLKTSKKKTAKRTF